MALLIEAFDEIKQDTVSIDAMKQWLVKNKQTNHWKTTKATADACFALLLQGSDVLSTQSDMSIRLDNSNYATSILSEKGTGYFISSIPLNTIDDKKNVIQLLKTSPGSAYGAIYYQYTEELDKVKSQNTSNPLSVSKQLFREIKTNKGLILEEISNSTTLSPGDRIISRIVFSSDRPMEYVHLKDMRASGLEPENVLSKYKIRQGLSYYESTKDLATHYFISYVPRGTYVFEYPSRVTHYGVFSNGITQIQCMYAPEFTSHTEGIKITINKKD